MRFYEWRHIVSFEETNLVGNVYFANHVRWQGTCREMFLRDHAVEILEQLGEDLALVTLNVSCEYLSELLAFDQIVVRMRLAGLRQNRVSLHFEYWRVHDSGEELVAKGDQEIATMRRVEDKLEPTPIPEALSEALRPYQ